MNDYDFKHLPYSDCVSHDDDDTNELGCDGIIEEIDTVDKQIIVIKDDRVLYYYYDDAGKFQFHYKTLYYYITVPAEGLTYKSLFSQMEEQYLQNEVEYRQYYFTYDTEAKEYRSNSDHVFIECFSKISPVMYELCAGS